MTDPTPDAPEPTPLPLRISSVLAGIVGIVTTLVALGTAAGASGQTASMINSVFGALAGTGLLVASYLVFRRRRLGAWIVLAAFALPSLVGTLTMGKFHPPPLLLILATLTLLANWPLLL